MNRYLVTCCFLIIVLAVIAVTAGEPVRKDGKADSRKEAERLWELAIKAKGGRAKLHGVRNMVISSSTKKARNTVIRNGKIKKSKKTYGFTMVTFDSLPDKWWRWGCRSIWQDEYFPGN